MDFVPLKTLTYLTYGKEINGLVNLHKTQNVFDKSPGNRLGSLQQKDKYQSIIHAGLKSEFNGKTFAFKKPRLTQALNKTMQVSDDSNFDSAKGSMPMPRAQRLPN